MFKPLLHLTITATIILLASPAFAESMSFQLSVTIPPHAMPSAQVDVTEQNTALQNGVAEITDQQVIQREQITRNDTTVTVQSVVVL